jgi:hypothetical protein
MIPITLKVDITEMLNVLSTEQANKTHALVLNKLATRARKETRKRITEKYNLKASAIKLKIRRAKASHLRAFLYAYRYRPYSLLRFTKSKLGDRPPGGITIEVERGKTILIEGAFIQRSTVIGQPAVMIRLSNKQYPIDVTLLEKRYSFILSREVSSDSNVDKINAMISEQAPILLQQTIDDQIKRRLSKIDIDIEPGDE